MNIETLKRPFIGIGTYRMNDQEKLMNVISHAKGLGLVFIDTSPVYLNEIKLGKIMHELGRDNFLIQNKVWNTERGYENTLNACKKSLGKMKMNYFDSYLIHFPATSTKYNPEYRSWKEINAETYRALMTLKKDGLVKQIGVSNFMPFQLDELKRDLNVFPEINQIEYHPGYLQEECVNYCNQHNIRLQAASPLGNAKILDDKVITDMAKGKDVSPAQLCLKYALLHGISPLPKTENTGHLEEFVNLDFELSKAELYYLERMKPLRVNWPVL